MNCSFEDINIRVESLIKNKIDLEKKLTKHNLVGSNNVSEDILKKVEEINGCKKLVVDQIEFSGNILDLGDQIRSKLKNGVAIIGIVNNDRPVVLCAVTDSLVSLFNAGNLVSKIGKKMNGGGGGKPHLAQAGGKDVSLLPDVLKFGKELIINRLKNEKTNTIFGKSDPGVSGVSLPKSDVPNVNIDKIIDDEFLRKESPNIPEVPESPSCKTLHRFIKQELSYR